MAGDRGNNSNWKLSLAYATHTVPFSPNSRLVLAVYRSYTNACFAYKKEGGKERERRERMEGEREGEWGKERD